MDLILGTRELVLEGAAPAPDGGAFISNDRLGVSGVLGGFHGRAMGRCPRRRCRTRARQFCRGANASVVRKNLARALSISPGNGGRKAAEPPTAASLANSAKRMIDPSNRQLNRVLSKQGSVGCSLAASSGEVEPVPHGAISWERRRSRSSAEIVHPRCGFAKGRIAKRGGFFTMNCMVGWTICFAAKYPFAAKTGSRRIGSLQRTRASKLVDFSQGIRRSVSWPKGVSDEKVPHDTD